MTSISAASAGTYQSAAAEAAAGIAIGSVPAPSRRRTSPRCRPPCRTSTPPSAEPLQRPVQRHPAVPGRPEVEDRRPHPERGLERDADVRPGRRVEGRVSVRLRQGSRRSRRARRSGWTRRRRRSASGTAAIGLLVFDRRHLGFVVQRRFGRRPPPAVPAGTAELAVVVDFLQRGGNKQHDEQQRLVALRAAHRLPELIQATHTGSGSTQPSFVREGWLFHFPADGSLFRAATHIRNCACAQGTRRISTVCSSSVSDQGENSMLAKYIVGRRAGSLLLASAAFAAEDTATKPAPSPSAATTSDVEHLVPGRLARLEDGRPQRLQRAERERRLDQRPPDGQERKRQGAP